MVARYPTGTPHLRRRGIRGLWDQMLRFRIPSNPLSRATIRVAGAYSVIQGVGIIWGGDIRWSGVTYSVVRDAPGGPTAWGVIAIIFGVITLTGSAFHHWRVKAVGLLGISGWSLSFAYGFLVATFTEPAAATTAGPAYAFICVTTAILVWIDEEGRDASL